MKKLVTKGLQLASLTLVLASLVGCSGSSGNGKNNASPSAGSQSQNGQFVDALVGGLRYQGAGESGIKLTGDQGEYSCTVGSNISFYLDQDGASNILLGQVQCRAVISPIELVTNGQKNITTSLNDLTATERQKVVNMLRIMQSLDIDLDVSNGVYLEATVMEDVVEYLIFKSGSEAEASNSIQAMLALNATDFDAELNAMLNAIGRSGKSVSEAQAVAHFEAYRQNCTESGCNAPAVVIPENRYACIAGYTLMAEDSFHVSIVDTMVGQIRAQYQGQEEVAATLIVVYEDKSAKVYRRANAGFLGSSQTIFSNSAFYTQFNGSWSFDDESEVLSVNDVQFQGSQEDFVFESVANLGVTTIIMSDNSSAVETQSDGDIQAAITNWVVKHNCSLPPANDARNLGSGN